MTDVNEKDTRRDNEEAEEVGLGRGHRSRRVVQTKIRDTGSWNSKGTHISTRSRRASYDSPPVVLVLVLLLVLASSLSLVLAMLPVLAVLPRMSLTTVLRFDRRQIH